MAHDEQDADMNTNSTYHDSSDLRAEAENVVLSLEQFGKKLVSHLKDEQVADLSKNMSKCRNHLHHDEKTVSALLPIDQTFVKEVRDFLNKIRKQLDPSLKTPIPNSIPIFEVWADGSSKKYENFLD